MSVDQNQVFPICLCSKSTNINQETKRQCIPIIGLSTVKSPYMLTDKPPVGPQKVN